MRRAYDEKNENWLCQNCQRPQAEHGGKNHTGLCPYPHRQVAYMVGDVVTIKPHERRWRECTMQQFEDTRLKGGYSV